MGCNDGFDDAHIERMRRQGEIRRIRERFGPVKIGEMTFAESRVLHSTSEDLSDADLATLKAAERRIFWAKERKGDPYNAGKARGSYWTPGRNHI